MGELLHCNGKHFGLVPLSVRSHCQVILQPPGGLRHKKAGFRRTLEVQTSNKLLSFERHEARRGNHLDSKNRCNFLCHGCNLRDQTSEDLTCRSISEGAVAPQRAKDLFLAWPILADCFYIRGGAIVAANTCSAKLKLYGQELPSFQLWTIHQQCFARAYDKIPAVVYEEIGLRPRQSSSHSRLLHKRTPLSGKFGSCFKVSVYSKWQSRFPVLARARPWWESFLLQRITLRGTESESTAEGIATEEIDSLLDSEDDSSDEDVIDSLLKDDDKFAAWMQRREAINELREYQETGVDPDSRDWEDWLDNSWGDKSDYMGTESTGWYTPQPEWEKDGVPRDPPKKPERGMNRTINELLMRIFENQAEVEDELGFEERVFQFTTRSTVKFVSVLILVPWFVDFTVHDFVLVPFLRRYVETVPLAAQVLDVKESQKLKMVEILKLERQRVRFEAEIGKAPPLSDEELNKHIREEAFQLQGEIREENRSAFANLFSDALAGLTVFLLLIFNPEQVSILRMTGDRVFTNISDTGKAFIIILFTDIFLGYHSESGWETVIEMVLDHYGFEVAQASIYIFVAIVPVTIDACFKLWVFRALSRLSPSAAATFREMKRH